MEYKSFREARVNVAFNKFDERGVAHNPCKKKNPSQRIIFVFFIILLFCYYDYYCFILFLTWWTVYEMKSESMSNSLYEQTMSPVEVLTTKVEKVREKNSFLCFHLTFFASNFGVSFRTLESQSSTFHVTAISKVIKSRTKSTLQWLNSNLNLLTLLCLKKHCMCTWEWRQWIQVITFCYLVMLMSSWGRG